MKTVGTAAGFCNAAAFATMSRDANLRAAVQRAMRAVPRPHFVPEDERAHAHHDTPLPIACGQTISQPSLVAFMTENLALTPASRVLEVGTGSGYQTAILAELAANVFTVERIEQLVREAQTRLTALGYRNINFRIGDGALGWAEEAPFDAIIVTAAAATVPLALTGQLRMAGRLVIPLGPPHGEQKLLLVEKLADGELRATNLLDVRFVPLVTP